MLFLGVAGIFGPACGISISVASVGRCHWFVEIRIGMDEWNIYGANRRRFLPQGLYLCCLL